MAVDYLSVANLIPPKSTFVRLRYPTPHAAEKFGYEGIGRDPLAHLAGLAAAHRRLVDLSDYEPLSKIFPVVFKKAIDPGWQSGLWAMEGPDSGSVESLAWVNRSLPAPIDFVLVIGEENSPESVRAGMPKMLEYLDSNMRLVATSPDRLFRLYSRVGGASQPVGVVERKTKQVTDTAVAGAATAVQKASYCRPPRPPLPAGPSMS
jgi:hypothetical protein